MVLLKLFIFRQNGNIPKKELVDVNLLVMKNMILITSGKT